MIDTLDCIEEIRRLAEGPKENEPVPGVGLVQFVVICNGNSLKVLETVVAVMTAICLKCSQGYPDYIDWRTVLPERFVQACAKEMSPEESERWLQRWQTLSDKEREEDERNRTWSVDNWMYWMGPHERAWQWWDARVVSSERINVSLAVDSWPFGWGSVAWLFRGSGASDAVPVAQATGT
ncbi:hypothetical protein [Achromobacter agilis]|uniref:hypothetical protein n=1 Tax=Achromobacter agilis TaxID=1353888 RepID=UPI001011F1B8|nr:hypothetical protein [Achromobacter agilis]